MAKKEKTTSKTKGGGTHDDPLSQIQKEESKVQQKLSKKETENHEKLEKLADVEEKKITEAEEKTRAKGNQQIVKAKEKAGEALKGKLAAAQREVQSIEEKATSSKEEAVDLVVKSFEKVIT